MTISDDSKEKQKKLSFKFSKALEFLNEYDKRRPDVMKIVNEKKEPQEKQFDDQEFSKLSRIHENNKYTSGTAIPRLSLIFRILDPFIEEFYNAEYDEDEKIYKLISEDINNPRLWGITGRYIGYSWHNSMEMVHMFKINIISTKEIICVTHNATLTAKRMNMIGSNAIAIEMKGHLRQVSLIMEIGNATLENLKTTTTFNVAYVDSGNKNLKCGLAIIERTENHFDDLQPMSKPLSEFEGEKNKEFFDLIKNKQLILK